jgi:hypothetical protein
MRKTTNYKRYRDGGAVEAQTSVPLRFEIDTPAAHEAADAATEGLLAAIEPQQDGASAAFQAQIDALRRSEDIQRDRAAKEARVQQILKANPDMLSNPDITAMAEREVLKMGHEPYSDQFHEAVKNSFDQHMGRKSKPDTAPMFEPLPEPRTSSFVSAPVSRETQANGSFNSHGERPGVVHLTLEMKDMARRLGQTEAEYARGLEAMRARDKDYGR